MAKIKNECGGTAITRLAPNSQQGTIVENIFTYNKT